MIVNIHLVYVSTTFSSFLYPCRQLLSLRRRWGSELSVTALACLCLSGGSPPYGSARTEGSALLKPRNHSYVAPTTVLIKGERHVCGDLRGRAQAGTLERVSRPGETPEAGT